MDLEKVVAEALEKAVSSGKVQEMVQDKLNHCIDSVMGDIFSSWGDVAKALKVTAQMNMEGMELSLPDFAQRMGNMVNDYVDKYFKESDVVKKILDPIFAPLEKQEWKVSEIIEKFKHEVVRDEDSDKDSDEDFDDDPEFSLYVQKDTMGYGHVFFDKEAHVEKYACAYLIAFTDKGEIYNAKIDSTDASRVRTSPLYSFDAFMFALFARKATIIVDVDTGRED